MKKERINERSEELGSIGIGAMIVFIALILVAAVASAVIIQTGEKLQQNAQKTGSDTQNEISGKISIINVAVGVQTPANSEAIVLVFETAPGSEPIGSTNIFWSVICDGTATAPAITDGDMSTATLVTLVGGAQATISPGLQYTITITIGSATAANDCAPALNDEQTLIVSVNGGGSTYETLTYTDMTQGASVV